MIAPHIPASRAASVSEKIVRSFRSGDFFSKIPFALLLFAELYVIIGIYPKSAVCYVTQCFLSEAATRLFRFVRLIRTTGFRFERKRKFAD